MEHLQAAIANTKAKFCCVNSLDMGTPQQQRDIVAWISQRLGIDFLSMRNENESHA